MASEQAATITDFYVAQIWGLVDHRADSPPKY
jgi:hypothetical protein